MAVAIDLHCVEKVGQKTAVLLSSPLEHLTAGIAEQLAFWFRLAFNQVSSRLSQTVGSLLFRFVLVAFVVFDSSLFLSVLLSLMLIIDCC